MKAEIEKWALKYEGNEVIRSLIKLVPSGIGSAIDSFISIRLNKLLRKRKRVFFTEIASGKKHLTPEMIDSDDFLHAFFKTTDAAMRTHRVEKIRLFARILKNAALSDSLKNVDEYEEYLQILDELSLREIGILTIMDGLSEESSGAGHLNRYVKDWNQFFLEVQSTYHVERAECIATLMRMNRTGCYSVGYIQTAKDFAGGYLTPIWTKLKTLVSVSE